MKQSKGLSGFKAVSWRLYAIAGVFIFISLIISIVTFSITRQIVRNAPVDAAQNEPSFSFDAASEELGEGSEELFSEGRTTILLMGIDEREVESGPWRTDTMIILTIDSVANTAGMLSIPRDLWVEIPNYESYDKVNTAHFLGDFDQLPGGGPALALETVQYNLGIPVNYYATVNFQAFVNGIDEVGCIPIDVPQTIDDPNYPDGAYGYDPFYIEAGEQCLDGDTLLKYARTRATLGSDFDRSARQQQVIYAVRDHILSTEQMPSLITRSPQLYATVEEGINTNLSLSQMIDLARVGASIPRDNICSLVLNDFYTEPQVVPEKGDVLIPDREAIRNLVSDLFTGTGRCVVVDNELETQATAQRPTVTVLNGTQRQGIATEARNVLFTLGFDVETIGNTGTQYYPESVIYNYNELDASAQYIALALGIPESQIETSGGPESPYDIQIVLGEDYTE